MATVILHLTDVGGNLNVKFHSDPQVVDAQLTAAQYYGLWAMECIQKKIKEAETLFEYGDADGQTLKD